MHFQRFLLHRARGERECNAFLANIKHKTGVKRVKVVDAHAFLVGFSLCADDSCRFARPGQSCLSLSFD